MKLRYHPRWLWYEVVPPNCDVENKKEKVVRERFCVQPTLILMTSREVRAADIVASRELDIASHVLHPHATAQSFKGSTFASPLSFEE